MIQKKLYRYVGRNGFITSLVLLDNIDHIAMMRLIADDDKVLTNGNTKAKSVDVFVEDMEQWTEIAQEDN